jgi:hypothetical protein
VRGGPTILDLTRLDYSCILTPTQIVTGKPIMNQVLRLRTTDSSIDKALGLYEKRLEHTMRWVEFCFHISIVPEALSAEVPKTITCSSLTIPPPTFNVGLIA